MSITFKVDQLEPDHSRDREPTTWREVIAKRATKKPRPGGAEGFMAPVEAASDVVIDGRTTKSALVETVGLAYNTHRPLSLSPDHIWLAIAHGFAQHVKMNAEELRAHFVKHEGKQYLEVEADGFIKGSSANDWPRVFQNFSNEIAKHIGKKRDLLVSDFTTTGPVEKIASEVVLMDAMSEYFEYGMRTLCGFTEITLEGTPEDWRTMLVRVGNLREFGNIGWWIDPLEMVIAKLVETADGSPDLAFWRSFYVRGGGSGGPYINGWVNVFYPFLGSGKRTRRNEALIEERLRPMLARLGKGHRPGMEGPALADFSSQLSSVPVKWKYLGVEYQMQFIAGLGGGTVIDAKGTLRPAVVWAVLDVTSLTEEQRKQI